MSLDIQRTWGPMKCSRLNLPWFVSVLFAASVNSFISVSKESKGRTSFILLSSFRISKRVSKAISRVRVWKLFRYLISIWVYQRWNCCSNYLPTHKSSETHFNNSNSWHKHVFQFYLSILFLNGFDWYLIIFSHSHRPLVIHCCPIT